MKKAIIIAGLIAPVVQAANISVGTGDLDLVWTDDFTNADGTVINVHDTDYNQVTTPADITIQGNQAQISHTTGVARQTFGAGGQLDSSVGYATLDFSGSINTTFGFGGTSYLAGLQEIAKTPNLQTGSYAIFFNNTLTDDYSYDFGNGVAGVASAGKFDVWFDSGGGYGLVTDDGDTARGADVAQGDSAGSFGYIVNRNVATGVVTTDNLRVYDVVPEPSSVALISLTAAGMLVRRRRRA